MKDSGQKERFWLLVTGVPLALLEFFAAGLLFFVSEGKFADYLMITFLICAGIFISRSCWNLWKTYKAYR